MIDVEINPEFVIHLKASLRLYFPGVGSSHRLEAASRGLGFQSFAGLSASSRGQIVLSSTPMADRFMNFLEGHDYLGIDPMDFLRAVGLSAIRIVTSQHELLCSRQMGYGQRQRKQGGGWETPREEYARKQKDREELSSQWCVDGFLLSLAFLRRLSSIKTINAKTGSYRLKHIAENYSHYERDFGQIAPTYVSNGTFIAAALHRGLMFRTYKDDQGNTENSTFFNLSEKAIIDIDCEIRPDGGAGARSHEGRSTKGRKEARHLVFLIARHSHLGRAAVAL
jgi:hypothetical protein